jgi:hypothetical protein
MGSPGEAVCRPWLGLPQPGCTGLKALVIKPLGEEEGREGEDDERRITVVIGPVGAPTIHRTAHISVDPRGRPQGPPVPRTETTPLSSPTSPTLVAPSPLALPSPEAGPLGSGTPLELLSPCGNWVLWRFARFATPSSKGRCDRTTSEMRGLSPKIISGDSR